MNTEGGNDTLVSIENIEGTNGGDELTGDAGDNILRGGAGNDTLAGGSGFDVADYATSTGAVNVNLGTGRATADGQGDADTLSGIEGIGGSAHNDTLTGSTLTGSGLYESFEGRAGNDLITGGLGTDWATYGSAAKGIHVNLSLLTAQVTQDGLDGKDTLSGIENIGGSDFDDVIIGNAIANELVGGEGQDTITGGAGNDTLRGGYGVDSLVGGDGDDQLFGDGNNDVLVGGAGNDTLDASWGEAWLQGGVGNDTYVINQDWGVVVDETSGSGIDTIQTTYTSFSLENFGAIENLIHAGEAGEGVDFYGNALANRLEGSLADDDLYGSAGADTLVGRGGSDNLDGGAGNDNLQGDESGDYLAGGEGNDNLSGGAGGDDLDGGSGADTMVGGTGDDTYYVDNVADVVSETGSNATLDGVDHVYVRLAGGTYTLGANVEDATVANAGEGEPVSNLNLTGNALANRLEGSYGNNVLAGGLGDDTLIVGYGNDTLDGGAGANASLAGSDTVIFMGSRASWGVASELATGAIVLTDGENRVELRNIENFVFTLDGAGALSRTQLLGGTPFTAGNNTWVGTTDDDNSGDAGLGTDSLVGSAGNDTLNGGGGKDTMVGGTGNDTFVVSESDDVVVEMADTISGADTILGGNDRVQVAFTAAGTYTLADHVEDGYITTALSGVNLTGNSGDNVLVGGDGANTIVGGGGNDSLIGEKGIDRLVGGTGDDTYYVDAYGDVVVEGNDSLAGSEDRVYLSVTTAGTYLMTANVEELQVVFEGGDSIPQINITGNASDNDIMGHHGSNVLIGGAGDDVLEGRGGNDTLDGGGNTTLEGGGDYAVMQGSEDDYDIEVLSATDTLFTHRESGERTLLRGVEFVEFNWGKSVVDLADLLEARGGTALADVIVGEDEEFGGDELSGGAGNDLLRGLSGNDVLLGGLGADTLVGGEGDDDLGGGAGGDTYVWNVGDGDDVIDENDTMAGAIDKLVLGAGAGNIAGGEVRFFRGWDYEGYDDGDDWGPIIISSFSDEEEEIEYEDLVIEVSSGDDGWQSEVVVIEDFFNATMGTVNTAKAIESIVFTDGGTTMTIPQILQELLKGTGEGDDIRGYATADLINGLDGDDDIEGGGGADTLIGNWGDDELEGDDGNDILTGNMGDDNLEGGNGNDNLHGGAGYDDLYGDNGSDVLMGGTGDDDLDGGAGMDTLIGGAGDDYLYGGDGSDQFVLDSLDGDDYISDFDNFGPDADKIVLSKSVFTMLSGGTGGPATNLAGLGSAFTYDTDSGALTYDRDGAGSAEGQVIAHLGSGTILGNDFLIVA